ncbi:MAG: DUF4860 domain-containing protein [Lachnospiraceae bacterium]
MKFSTQKKHMVDFLFPIALFFVFASSSLMVILLSSHAYQQTQTQARTNYAARTSLSYLSQKIRQNDETGAVSLGKLQSQDALIIKQVYHKETYLTYIYQYEGALRELFLKEGADIPPASGKPIAKVDSFTVEAVNPQLYRFTVTTSQGTLSELFISLHSGS